MASDGTASAYSKFAEDFNRQSEGRQSEGPRMTIACREEVRDLQDELEEQKVIYARMKSKWQDENNTVVLQLEKERIKYGGDVAGLKKSKDQISQQYQLNKTNFEKEKRVAQEKLLRSDEERIMFKGKLMEAKGGRAVTQILRELEEMRKRHHSVKYETTQVERDSFERDLHKERKEHEDDKNRLLEQLNKLKTADEKARLKTMFDQKLNDLEKNVALLQSRLGKKTEELDASRANEKDLKQQLSSSAGGGKRVAELEAQIRQMREAHDQNMANQTKKSQDRITELNEALKQSHKLRDEQSTDANNRLDQLRKQKERAEAICIDYRAQHERILGVQHLIETERKTARDEGGEPKSKKQRGNAK